MDVWADTPRMLQLSLFKIAIQQLFDRWSIKNQHHVRLPNRVWGKFTGEGEARRYDKLCPNNGAFCSSTADIQADSGLLCGLVPSDLLHCSLIENSRCRVLFHGRAVQAPEV